MPLRTELTEQLDIREVQNDFWCNGTGDHRRFGIDGRRRRRRYYLVRDGVQKVTTPQKTPTF